MGKIRKLDLYRNKRVLITGHTGFKGSWLAYWLYLLGANVTGYSSYLPSRPCHYEAIELGKRMNGVEGDTRDISKLEEVFKHFKPDIVFHLAAQPIVRTSYKEPKLTFDTNVGGTVNVLECVRKYKTPAAVMITSDKCYDNVNWEWGYRENDRLGGEDPYSLSKACAEHVISAYSKMLTGSSSIASVRAGNVIGGGDWAVNRIVPDAVRAFANKLTLKIRNPHSTRPWQHVLEPLRGYLLTGVGLLNKDLCVVGEAFNFGPRSDADKTVEQVVASLAEAFGGGRWQVVDDKSKMVECQLLRLNCDKALNRLKYKAVLSFRESMDMTAEWYVKYYNSSAEPAKISADQLSEYLDKLR